MCSCSGAKGVTCLRETPCALPPPAARPSPSSCVPHHLPRLRDHPGFAISHVSAVFRGAFDLTLEILVDDCEELPLICTRHSAATPRSHISVHIRPATYTARFAWYSRGKWWIGACRPYFATDPACNDPRIATHCRESGETYTDMHHRAGLCCDSKENVGACRHRDMHRQRYP
jgi:hypothetical protein